MKLKNIDITAIVDAYTAGKEDGEGLKLPASVAWKRRVNMTRLIQTRQIIDEALDEVRKRYADDEHSVAAGEDGQRKVKPEYIRDFVKEQGDVLTQETEVNISTIKIDELGNVELTDAQMDTLAFMIGEGE